MRGWSARTTKSRSPTPAAASARNSCRRSSSDSASRNPAPARASRDWASASPSSSTWSTSTTAPSMWRAKAWARARPSACGCRSRSGGPASCPADQSSRLKRVRVLVVEDDPDARALIARILADAGASVSDAPNAEAAMTHIKATVPDVLVSDIGMAQLDGYQLLRNLRAAGFDAAAAARHRAHGVLTRAGSRRRDRRRIPGASRQAGEGRSADRRGRQPGQSRRAGSNRGGTAATS